MFFSGDPRLTTEPRRKAWGQTELLLQPWISGSRSHHMEGDLSGALHPQQEVLFPSLNKQKNDGVGSPGAGRRDLAPGQLPGGLWGQLTTRHCLLGQEGSADVKSRICGHCAVASDILEVQTSHCRSQSPKRELEHG